MKLLEDNRRKIDSIDDQIVDLLARRLGVIHDVAILKKQNNIPAILPDRVNEVIERCVLRAVEKGVDPDLVRALYTTIIDHACVLEEKLMTKS